MTIAEIIDVSHSYGRKLAINQINVGFEEKKITAIIGKSGSGKSTLLQLLNGLINPSSGSVSLFKKALDYNAIHSVRTRMGYMVQGTGLFPHLTIDENISIAGKLVARQNISSARVDELMDLVSLPKTYKRKYPFELSGGEQQRVGICRALFLDPPILLMDEPLGALDPLTRQEIQNEILRLQQLEPRTVILVTHDMREAKILADYILIMDEGEVQQFDATQTVLKKPVNAIVKKLIEASLS